MISALVLYTLIFEAGRFWVPAVLEAWREEIAEWSAYQSSCPPPGKRRPR